MLTRLTSRCLVLSLIVASGLFMSGCYGGRRRLRQSQLMTMQMYKQNQAYAGQLQSAQQMAAQLSAENQQLAANLDNANQRLANLGNERSQLHDQYKNLLTGLRPGDNPLNSAASRKFEELARKYPEFEFDPTTGVSRFNGDLLFASGSDEIQAKGRQVLDEFSRIMNDADAKQFHVLVVGHTDDMPVVKAVTKSQHPTNWDLSVHRATAVVKTLAKMGIEEPRLGAAGYSKYQETTANVDETGRQKNRRVEIFVLAPDARIAGWDPATRR
jgi:chemotaxis protein MotB